MRRFILWIVLVVSTLPFSTSSVDADAIDFNSQIRPLLQKNCMACHGGVKKAGGISFLSRSQAMGRGKSGERTIVPGNREASELVRRITSPDPDDRMPPEDERPGGLSAQEVDLLLGWIDAGADWTEHWAFELPQAQKLPEVSDASWPRTRLDHFILARLDREGLKPNSEADRAQWLRRASFDITGLPPSPEDLELFLPDKSPEAHRAAVDRLLESQSFGERWAAMWLDLARYADSQGYEKDRHRDVWAYRDWVIRSFNADMPFDQFTVKQLAGDLLPDGGLDDVVATAFHRNTQTNTEGGTDDEEFRVAAVIDRINTTWLVWQGMTFRCAQCHSHPYDPFKQEEFYRFYAFFNNTADADLSDDFPRLRVPLDRKKFDEAYRQDREIKALRRQLNDVGRKPASSSSWKPVPPEKVTGPGAARFSVVGNEVAVGGTVPQGSTYQLTAKVDGKISAVRVDILPRERDPKKLPEHGSVLSRFRVEIEPAGGQRQELKFAEVFAESLSGPFDPWESLKKGAPGGGSYPKLDGPTWLVFVLEESIDLPAGSTLHAHLTCSIRSAETKGAVLRRFRLATCDAAAWPALTRAPERIAAKKRLAQLQKGRAAIRSVTLPVMAERPQSAQRATRTFIRGNFLEKDREVSAGVPAVMHPFPRNADANRLAVARWLVSPENPLTARVFVNRVWAELFGVGIVETLEDFGSRGQPPSHPALLDDLARRFQSEHGWRLKPLLRELVLSATYRQDHRVTPGLRAMDPQNRLLERGPRTRLTAEMVRDQALAAAGLLSTKMFGPSVMPPQPDGVWSVVYSGAKWKVPKGEDRYRRAVYTYLRRTSPYPSFLTFDAPSREFCVARRITTNTPLQALVTLNDPVYVECAQALAKRMRARGLELSEQIRMGHRLVAQAAPSPSALERLKRLHQSAAKEYAADPTAAKKLASTPSEAALVLVASVLLNLDAALTK